MFLSHQRACRHRLIFDVNPARLFPAPQLSMFFCALEPSILHQFTDIDCAGCGAVIPLSSCHSDLNKNSGNLMTNRWSL
ncbi:hypothetical protein CY34DRAFT_805112, partial [Suillus luteus UH-Slu-Lm8-n1]